MGLSGLQKPSGLVTTSYRRIKQDAVAKMSNNENKSTDEKKEKPSPEEEKFNRIYNQRYEGVQSSKYCTSRPSIFPPGTYQIPASTVITSLNYLPMFNHVHSTLLHAC